MMPKLVNRRAAAKRSDRSEERDVALNHEV
jgi:hypothetical protein